MSWISQMMQQTNTGYEPAPDYLTATDEELLDYELKSFRKFLKLHEGNPYGLYRLYRDGANPTGAGKDEKLAERYLRQAAVEEGNTEALRELAERENADETDPFLEHMMTTQTTRKRLTDYFIRLSYDVLGNILPLDDALQDWTKLHPEQRKLAEALRIHYLLYVYTTGWKTSPENNDVRREVRKRLLSIIRDIPVEVMDTETKKYLQQTFAIEDAVADRQLRRWHTARKTTPPRRKSKNHR